jgi:hypothetical protein
MLDSYVADKNVIVAERVEPKRETFYCVNEIEKVVENLKLIFNAFSVDGSKNMTNVDFERISLIRRDFQRKIIIGKERKS